MPKVECALLLIAVTSIGCRPAESDWTRQLRAVVSGESQRISLEARPITATELTQLPEVSGKLLELLLDEGGVTDESMQWIAQVKGLEHLRIRHSSIGKRGIEVLAAGKVGALRILNLPQSSLDASGIDRLVGLPNLVQLRLGGEQLDDEAAQALAKLPGLRSLHLIGPKLTDKALEYLAAAPRLSSLYIDDCPLSDAAWQQLFLAKPNLHVHIDQQHHDRDPNREHL